MKAIAIGYFNAGFTIGLDDYFFERTSKAELQEFVKRFPYPVSTDGIVNVSTRLGKGLSFDLSQTSILKNWCEGAKRIVDSDEFYKVSNLTPEQKGQIIRIIESEMVVPALSLTVYACGTVLLELTLDRIDDEVDGLAVLHYTQLFEYAAYNIFESNVTFHPELFAIPLGLLDYFAEKNPVSFKSITNQPVSECEIPSFTLLFFSSHHEVIDGLKEYCRDSWSKVADVHINHDRAFGSWYIWGGYAMKESNQRELIDVIKLYTLYYGTSESVEKLLTGKISQSVHQSVMTKEEIIQLQTISNILVNNTNLQMATQNGEYIAVLNIMENVGNLHVFHEAILRSIQVLADIQSQVINELEKRKAEEDQLRNERINKFVVIFTSFTFISVLADLFNLDQYSSILINNPLIRVLVYAGLFILGAFALYRLLSYGYPSDSSCKCKDQNK